MGVVEHTALHGPGGLTPHPSCLSYFLVPIFDRCKLVTPLEWVGTAKETAVERWVLLIFKLKSQILQRLAVDDDSRRHLGRSSRA